MDWSVIGFYTWVIVLVVSFFVSPLSTRFGVIGATIMWLEALRLGFTILAGVAGTGVDWVIVILCIASGTIGFINYRSYLTLLTDHSRQLESTNAQMEKLIRRISNR